MNLQNKLAESASILKANIKLRPYADSIARKMGYELVGSGGGWSMLSGYKLFRRKLPEAFGSAGKDPYLHSFKVKIDSITSRVGFSYAEDGWHPFVQTLKEYSLNPEIIYKESTLYQLYRQFQPRNVHEVLLDQVEVPQKPMCDWPARNEFLRWIWVLNRSSVNSYLKNLKNKKSFEEGWIFFGPHNERYGEKEFQRLTGVFDSIKSKGYRTGLTDLDPVNGYFLKRGKDTRFVLLQGNHRVSALKALGYREVDVLIRRGHPAVIDRSDLYQWTVEGGGLYPSNLAYLVFDELFNESGLQKARRYGLA